MPDAANDAGVEKARAAAEEHWKAQNGGQLDAPLTVEAVQKQVVAGAPPAVLPRREAASLGACAGAAAARSQPHAAAPCPCRCPCAARRSAHAAAALPARCSTPTLQAPTISSP